MQQQTTGAAATAKSLADVTLAPGAYVLAVSGGVDSMVLLDVLARRPALQLIAAHYDHGIRKDSARDRLLVQTAAAHLGLPFEYEEGMLGAQASEATARNRRYGFLERVRRTYGAQAIVTAHHQDDVLETAILNLVRGTGRRGLTSLASSATLVRPLLYIAKSDIHAYAAANGIAWREDSTNADQTYLRNYIRARLLPRFDAVARAKLLAIIARQRRVNAELDGLLASLLQTHSAASQLDRRWFTQLPHAAAKEVLAYWFRRHGVGGFDAPALERLAVAAKTFRPGTSADITAGARLAVTSRVLALILPER